MTFASITRFLLRGVAPAALLLVVVLPARAAAAPVADQAAEPDHIVSPQALQQQVQNSSAQRQQNIDTLTKMLDMPEAQKAMRNSKIDPVQVRNAIPTLSDEELSNLSARVTNAQQRYAGGVIGEGLLIIIILLVILIVVVAAVH